MTLAITERADGLYGNLDLWSTGDVVAAIIAAQQNALMAVQAAVPAFSAAVEALSGKLRVGGRMACGAGSSGLIAKLEALKLPRTFGIGSDRVRVILAGGAQALLCLPGAAENDASTGESAVDEFGIGFVDAVAAVATSGTTPFTLAALRRAKSRGALMVGIACVAGASLCAESHHAILIETPPEVVAGSTRMAARTAQKYALNVLSTGVAVRLEQVYAGLMVNMSPDNLKLKRRAVGIVAQAVGVGAAMAEHALGEADWSSLKTAVMLRLARIDADEARARLASSGGDIRAALAQGPIT